MGTLATIVAGLVLAAAATAGVVASAGGGPTGTPDTAVSTDGGDLTAVYDAGQ